MNETKFEGFEQPEENWSKLPNQLIDLLPQIETLGEMKIILYTLRHTWGFRDDYKKITLDEFENGRKRRDGTRLDKGTGLSKPTIINGIKRAISHRFLYSFTDTGDLGRAKKFYSLSQEGLKNLTPTIKKFNPHYKEPLHRSEKETLETNLSPPFADAKSAILTSGKPDNVSVTPEDTASFVSIFGSDNNIISEMRDILIAMSADGIVDHRAYKEQPDRSSFHWVDNGLPVKNIPLGLAKEYGYKSPEISGPPETITHPFDISDQPESVTYSTPGSPEVVEMTKPEIVLVDEQIQSTSHSIPVDDDIEIADILARMQSDGLIEQRPFEGASNWSGNHWVDSGKPVENIPLGLAKKYGYKSPETSGRPEDADILIKPEEDSLTRLEKTTASSQALLDRLKESQAEDVSVNKDGGYGQSAAEALGQEIMGGKVSSGTPIILDHNDQQETFVEADSFSNVSVDEQAYAADLVRLEVAALDIEIMQESNAPIFPSSLELGQEVATNQSTNAEYEPDGCTCAALAASGGMPPCSYCENSPESDNEFEETFGPNPRQAEIDAHKTKPKPSQDKWLLHALGAGIDPEIRRQIALMRDEGWKVRDEQVELAIAQFSSVTGFVLPTNKSTRKLWEHGVREHLAESHFEGRLHELYKKVWQDKKEAVREGKLTLAHPKSFTTLMYAVVNTERGPLNRPTRGQLLDLMAKDNLIELKQVGEAVGFFYVDTGELVGDDIPQKYTKRYCSR